MILITNPDRTQWTELLKRPVMNTENLFDTVRGIIDCVKAEGDCAVLRYEEQFDKVALGALTVTEEEQKEAEALVSEELKKAMLAESCCHRESGVVYPRWNGSTLFHCIDAGCSGKDCRM